MAELTELGNYKIVHEIAKTGMATVYEAVHPTLGRRAAVKKPHPHLTSQPGFRSRFLREAQTLASLSHPNIVRVYEAGGTADELFLAMEYVDGATLDDCIERGMYRTVRAALPVIRQLCEALDYIHQHEKRVVHRDIKPSNIMVKANGDVVLMDFGIARQDGQLGITHDGQTIGTPWYMSPEQCKGRKDIDWRSDIYSLAVVVYEMLSGVKPIEGENLMSVINRQITEIPRPISVLVPGLPANVVRAITKALSKDRAGRQQSATQFYNELAGLPLERGVAVRRPAARTRPVLIGIALASLVGLIVIMATIAFSTFVQTGGDGPTIRHTNRVPPPPPPPPVIPAQEVAQIRQCIDTGDTKKAKRLVKAMLTRSPDNSDANALKHVLYMIDEAEGQYNNGEYDAAESTLDNVLKSYRDCYPALMIMCAVRYAQGHYAEAREYWKRAYELQPGGNYIHVYDADLKKKGV